MTNFFNTIDWISKLWLRYRWSESYVLNFRTSINCNLKHLIYLLKIKLLHILKCNTCTSIYFDINRSPLRQKKKWKNFRIFFRLISTGVTCIFKLLKISVLNSINAILNLFLFGNWLYEYICPNKFIYATIVKGPFPL